MTSVHDYFKIPVTLRIKILTDDARSFVGIQEVFLHFEQVDWGFYSALFATGALIPKRWNLERAARRKLSGIASNLLKVK